MALNPFGTVKSYSAMLNKIATFTFFGTLAYLYVLAQRIPEVRAVIAWFPRVTIPIGNGLELSAGYLAPTLALAIVSRIFKLHDRISDLFGIRRRFDVAAVLMPLSLTAGVPLSVEKVRDLKHRRQELMGKLFYRYASSPAGKASIPEHYVTLALDQWSWYWIAVEQGFLILVAAAIALWLSHFLLSSLFLLTLLGVVEALNLLWDSRVNYALDEVEQIVQDAQRRIEIEEVLRAL